ncbi:TAXI family TRAP transporter solute-binding subunit [Pseudopelagicola sp. nBUS_19]|uniref:TAXI family TRAP transporter solute-binding subunit n=1 Tax=Pseudopelagicola sp. nBUS_19 TaxID=3395316 RepID=UPI003EB6E2D9
MRAWIAIVMFSLVSVPILILTLLLPPESLTFAAGPKGGAYAQVAERYKSILARDGIVVEVTATNGSVDNASALERGSVDVALLQGGIDISENAVEAIASVFYEPMFFLVRANNSIPKNPALWRGLTITSGTLGSGTRAVFDDFQIAVGLEPSKNQHVYLPYSKALDALMSGSVDMAVFVTTVDAPYLSQAYSSQEISFLPIDFAETISRRLEYATVVTLPKGSVSLFPVVPPEPQRMLALESRLVINPNLHPALINRLTMAAKELHSARDIITGPNTFPTVVGTAINVNTVSQQLIQKGPSTWHQWLPYWMAAQVNRLLLLTLPVLLLLVPMLRLFPSMYAYFMGWRVWQHYPKIRQIEDELRHKQDAISLSEMDSHLIDMDTRIASLNLPAAYRQAAYQARMHIDLVRKRIHDKNTGETSENAR